MRAWALTRGVVSPVPLRVMKRWRTAPRFLRMPWNQCALAFYMGLHASVSSLSHTCTHFCLYGSSHFSLFPLPHLHTLLSTWVFTFQSLSFHTPEHTAIYMGASFFSLSPFTHLSTLPFILVFILQSLSLHTPEHISIYTGQSLSLHTPDSSVSLPSHTWAHFHLYWSSFFSLSPFTHLSTLPFIWVFTLQSLLSHTPAHTSVHMIMGLHTSVSLLSDTWANFRFLSFLWHIISGAHPHIQWRLVMRANHFIVTWEWSFLCISANAAASSSLPLRTTNKTKWHYYVCDDSINTQRKRKTELKKEVFLFCLFNYYRIKLKVKENWSVNESFSSYHLCLKTIIICHVYLTFLSFTLLLGCVFSSQIRFSKIRKNHHHLWWAPKSCLFTACWTKGIRWTAHSCLCTAC